MAYLNPLTRDLVQTVDWDWLRVTNPTLEAIHIRLHTERGSCFWDLSFGSTLHLLPTETISADRVRDVEDRVRTALQPMVDAHEISGLTIHATRVARNRVDLSVQCLDAGRRPVTFTTFVQV